MVTNPDANEQTALRVPILVSRLREAQTVDSCVTEELGDRVKSGSHGEVVVTDNNSTVSSGEGAPSHGDRVIEVPPRS